MRLKGDDRVIGGCAVADGEVVVLATDQGFSKRTEIDDFPVQTRGGSGLKAAKIDKARGKLAAVAPAAETLAFLAADACLVVPGQGVRAASRDGGGSKVCPEGLQRVVAVAPPRDDA
jgi:DNA gyrase subunit A